MTENQTEKKEQVNYTNFVNVVGYLKDNTLKPTITQSKKEAISGQLIIALNDSTEFRIKYFASKEYQDGRANPLYATLQNMFPDKCVTVKTLLEANPGATFDDIKVQASKVWANGEFDIYDRKDEQGTIHTSVTLNGRGAGFHTANSKKPFAERATFKVEGYVNAIKDEKQGDTETGRLEVELLLPDTFRELVAPVPFIIPADLRDVVAQAWNKGDTVLAEGYLVNARKENAPTRAARQSLTGKMETIAPTYTFVNERIIDNPYGAYTEEDVKLIAADTIRKYNTNREKMLSELEVTADRDNKSNNGGDTAPATGAAGNSDKKFML